MDITITAEILSGNLGDGWENENAAADALADFTKTVWARDLAAISSKHRVEIEICVQHNTSGYCHATAIDVRCDDEDAADAAETLQQQVHDLLTDEDVIWDRFLNSDDAARY
jgi:hypothetical protein